MAAWTKSARPGAIGQKLLSHNELPDLGSSADATVVTDYTNLQNEEMDVLQAIYMDDFEQVDTRDVWNVCAFIKTDLMPQSVFDVLDQPDPISLLSY